MLTNSFIVFNSFDKLKKGYNKDFQKIAFLYPYHLNSDFN